MIIKHIGVYDGDLYQIEHEDPTMPFLRGIRYEYEEGELCLDDMFDGIDANLIQDDLHGSGRIKTYGRVRITIEQLKENDER